MGTVNAGMSPQLISALNSTSAPLGSGGLFTGVAQDVSLFSEIMLSISVSHDSAVDGLSVEFSSNGDDWDDVELFTIDATQRFVQTFPIRAASFRIRYTNGGTAQTHFRMQAICRVHPSPALWSNHYITPNLANINTTYDAVTTGASSGDHTCRGKRRGSFNYDLAAEGTPSRIRVIAEFRDQDGNHFELMIDYWDALEHEDTEPPISKIAPFQVMPGYESVRIRIAVIGTSLTNTFTIANAKLGLGT